MEGNTSNSENVQTFCIPHLIYSTAIMGRLRASEEYELEDIQRNMIRFPIDNEHSFGDLKEQTNLEHLNEILEKWSYVAGYQPSQQDNAVLQTIQVMIIETQKYPHINRWKNHIQSFGRKRLQFKSRMGKLEYWQKLELLNMSIQRLREVQQIYLVGPLVQTTQLETVAQEETARTGVKIRTMYESKQKSKIQEKMYQRCFISNACNLFNSLEKKVRNKVYRRAAFRRAVTSHARKQIDRPFQLPHRENTIANRTGQR